MFLGDAFSDFLIRLKRNPSDGIACITFHLILFFSFRLTMSEEAALWSKNNLFYHQIFSYFVVFNIVSSLWSLTLTDPSGKRIIYTDEPVRLGWEICWRCESHKPHRAIHCYQCRTCILKRDHHCIFAVNCVGYANMRYFYTMLFWTFIGIVYANIVNFEFITRILMDFNLLSILSFIAPLIAWAFGVLHEDFGAVFISTVLIGAFGYASFLVKIHSRSFLTGVTQGEINRLIFEYKTSLPNNMKDVFGSNWPIAWISPLIPSKLSGNGTHYEKKSTNQRYNVKSF